MTWHVMSFKSDFIEAITNLGRLPGSVKEQQQTNEAVNKQLAENKATIDSHKKQLAEKDSELEFMKKSEPEQNEALK